MTGTRSHDEQVHVCCEPAADMTSNGLHKVHQQFWAGLSLMLIALISNRHVLGCGAAYSLMSVLNSNAKVHLNNMIAVLGNIEQVACVIVCRLNGHANGPDTPPRPTAESNGVLSWAYPSGGGTHPRPGSASKTRHGKHSMVAAYGTADTAPSIHYMAAGFSLAALAVHGVTEGRSVAGGMVSDGTAVSNVAVPLYLTGALKGTAASVLAGVYCKQRPVQAGIAGAIIASFGPTAALVTLAQVPLGSIPKDFVLDTSGLTSKALSATSGALLVLALHVLTPIASQFHQQASLKGLSSGACCACLLFALRRVTVLYTYSLKCHCIWPLLSIMPSRCLSAE